MKTIVLFTTVLLNALSTGFFFAWSVSVILGTKKVADFTYLETMQSINREIINPMFFTVFFGSLITLLISTFFQFSFKPVFWILVASSALYLIGTIGVTAAGNVPLNNELELLNLKTMDPDAWKSFRVYYESKWNRYHLLRTLASTASFILLVLAVFIKK